MEHFQPKQNIKSHFDPLEPIFQRSFNLINYKTFNCFLFFAFCIYASTVAIFFYYLVSNFDSALLLQYGPIKFILLEAIAGTATFWLTIKSHMKMRRRILQEFWAITSPKILQHAKHLNYYNFFNYSVAIIVAFWHMPFMTNEKEFIFAVEFFKENLPPMWGRIMVFLLYFTLPLMCYMMIINTYLLSYPLLHMKFQKIMLNQLIQNISAGFEHFDDFDLVRNAKFQAIVALRLKMCIKHHILIAKFEKSVNDLSYGPILVIFSLSVVIIISIITSAAIMPETDFVRLGATLFAAAITIFFFMFSGQSSIDQSVELYENAKRVNWTGWTIRNRKSLLIFLINLKATPIIGVPGILTCEYEFLVGVVQLIGSVSTFFMEIAPNSRF